MGTIIPIIWRTRRVPWADNCNSVRFATCTQRHWKSAERRGNKLLKNMLEFA